VKTVVGGNCGSETSRTTQHQKQLHKENHAAGGGAREDRNEGNEDGRVIVQDKIDVCQNDAGALVAGVGRGGAGPTGEGRGRQSSSKTGKDGTRKQKCSKG